jgi:hypothetical protein
MSISSGGLGGLAAAIESDLGSSTDAAPVSDKVDRRGQLEADRLYDAFADLIDRTPEDQRLRALARLAVMLADQLADPARALRAAEAAAQAPQGGAAR